MRERNRANGEIERDGNYMESVHAQPEATNRTSEPGQMDVSGHDAGRLGRDVERCSSLSSARFEGEARGAGRGQQPRYECTWMELGR